jgi:hypothetical protein
MSEERGNGSDLPEKKEVSPHGLNVVPFSTHTNAPTNTTTTTTTGMPTRGVRIEQAFRVINQMVADGIIENYAIGGATGAFFYIEPDTTYDVDIFCVLSGIEEDALDMLRPI